MRIRPPSSRAVFKIRFSIFDVVLAAIAPLLALYVREAYILSYDGAVLAGIYCLVSLTFSLVAFAAFGVRDAMPRYFSVHDAIDLAKAVFVAELMTCIVLFTFTRLEGIPRSTPVIHGLILGAGLVSLRALAHLADRDRKLADRPRNAESENIILIGLNDLSSLYMKALEAFAAGRQRIIALLDDRPRAIGRSVHGVRVFGPPAHLRSLVEEFAVHGIRTDRVVVGGEADCLSDEALSEIEQVCAQCNIKLDYVPHLFGFGPATSTAEVDRAVSAPAAAAETIRSVPLRRYFRFKRLIDFIVALLLVIALLPVWLVVVCLAFLDVGAPILFWQQRTGQDGRHFLLHKIRTLRPPFDWRGRPIADRQRVSWIGQLLRGTRLDELPQLLNVLVGDMSLIGPRPLLPRDQPPTPAVRLMVRPGITGWAQVNGGKLLSPREKEVLDEWYIRNASLRLDLSILAMTLASLVRGDRRSEQALLAARNAARPGGDGETPSARIGDASHLVSTLIQDESPPPIARSW
jgi:lipopolysaccharide/colanic/teichoic acid biosynthesis glycosyltransferase